MRNIWRPGRGKQRQSTFWVRVEYPQGLRTPTCRILRAFYVCTVECCYSVILYVYCRVLLLRLQRGQVMCVCLRIVCGCVSVSVWVWVRVWVCGCGCACACACACAAACVCIYIYGGYVPQGKDKYANLIAGAPTLVCTNRLNPAFRTAAAAGRGG